MALSTARIHRVRGRPPRLAAGITSLIHSHSSSVRSLGYIVSFISPCYTTHEDFSDRLLGKAAWAMRAVSSGPGVMTCGWSDMRNILLLRGSRHRRAREPYYATAHSPGAPCR